MTPVVAIIGGGVSGAFTVLNSLRKATQPLNILWFDTNGLFCKGLAYSTTEEAHLLNVRASNMSAFADEPLHFVNWLKENGYPFDAKDFVPRCIYGTYVEDTIESFKDHNPNVKVIQVAEEVISVIKSEDQFIVKAKEEYIAGKVVLAIGNFLPAHPTSVSKEFIVSPCYLQNAFSRTGLDKITSKEHVTIIGAGLTMVDAVLALVYRNYKGKMVIISPHGYLPQPHIEQTQVIENFIDVKKTYSLLDLYGSVKHQLKLAKAKHVNPFAVIDALRPHAQQLWINFTHEDQLRFLRHLRHKWGVARHRAPSESMKVILNLIQEGVMTVVKGRIFNIETSEAGFKLFYRNGQEISAIIETSAIINCTGPEPDLQKTGSVLVNNLINSELMSVRGLSYGINASETGEISPGLFTIGPPLKGVLWESTAVPEIRVQAARLAAKIIFD